MASVGQSHELSYHKVIDGVESKFGESKRDKKLKNLDYSGSRLVTRLALKVFDNSVTTGRLNVISTQYRCQFSDLGLGSIAWVLSMR